MSDKINYKKEAANIAGVAEDDIAIDRKLDELITLLSHSHIDSAKARVLQEKLSKAIEGSHAAENNINAFRKLDTANTSRVDLLDEFSILLSAHQIDSNDTKKYLTAGKSSDVVLIIISIVLITLGFAMIIMPAPPSFEIFTVFYFTENDGVTVMDLVSLLVVLSGIYLLIKTLLKYPAKPR